MKKSRIILRIGLFLVGALIILFAVHSIFKISDKRVYQMMKGFYSEKEGDLDAVFIGASNVYAYWQAPLAWDYNGISVYAYSVPGMPVNAMTYVVEECRKTQPDALYIISLNNFKKDELGYTVAHVHYLTDFMPYSGTRAAVVSELLEKIDEDEYDSGEFTFPFIRFHDRWSELEEEDFEFAYNGLKGASAYGSFLKKTDADADNLKTQTELMELEEEVESELEKLLSYFKESDARVLFVINPQVLKNSTQKRLNTIEEIVKSEGFDVLNMQRLFYEMGLDPVEDFYNPRHTNVHGSRKFTYYLADYLQKEYGFENKKGDPAYADWEESYEKYYDIVSHYLLDFELEDAPRDYSMTSNTFTAFELTADSEAVYMSWQESENAEEYLIYRKEKDPETKELTQYQLIDTVDESVLSYTDDTVVEDYRYWYFVVPVRTEGDITYFGQFDCGNHEIKINNIK